MTPQQVLQQFQATGVQLRFTERRDAKRLLAENVGRIPFADGFLQGGERFLDPRAQQVGKAELHADPGQDRA